MKLFSKIFKSRKPIDNRGVLQIQKEDPTNYEAIINAAHNERITLMNEHWLKGTDHSFEEDPAWQKKKYEADYAAWEKEVSDICKKYKMRVSQVKEFIHDWVDRYNPGGYTYDDVPVTREQWDEICRVYGKKPDKPSSLYDYEISVMEDAEGVALFIMKHGGKDFWIKNFGGKTYSTVEDELADMGYKMSEGHSCNSLGMALTLAHALICYPDMYKYEHGSLCYLVGDEGYYDDRSEAKAYVEQREKLSDAE